MRGSFWPPYDRLSPVGKNPHVFAGLFPICPTFSFLRAIGSSSLAFPLQFSGISAVPLSKSLLFKSWTGQFGDPVNFSLWFSTELNSLGRYFDLFLNQKRRKIMPWICVGSVILRGKGVVESVISFWAFIFFFPRRWSELLLNSTRFERLFKSIWESAHPIGILLATWSRYFSDGSPFPCWMLLGLWSVGKSYMMGSFLNQF